MKTRAAVILLSCMLGGLSLWAVRWLDRQPVRLDEKRLWLERKERLETEMEETALASSETEAELEAVRQEMAGYQKELDEIREKAEALRELSGEDLILYETQTGGFPVNYDVENFRAKQRGSGQVGVMSGVFGSLFGNVIANSQQDYAAAGQEKRFDFYERLAAFLGESYWEAVTAEAAFDGGYLCCQELGEAETEADLFAAGVFLEETDSSLYESAREGFLDALAKYVFDLNCVSLIYDNTLTKNEEAFLSEMRQQVDSLKAVLAEYDPGGSYTGAGESRYGYTPEEKLERGRYVFGLYAEAAKTMVDYLYADGGMNADLELTAYHVGTIYGYANRGDMVMILEKDNPYDIDTWEYRFYDHEGRPLYLEEHQGKVLFLDGEAAAFWAATEVLQTQAVFDRLVDNAGRMYADYANGVLAHTYERYAY